MTNKDAISIIKIIGEDYIPRTTFQEVNEALDLAIKALEQIDLIKFNIFDEQEPKIDVFCENADDKTKEELKADLKAILDEIRPKGEWEESHIVSCGTILRMQYDVVEHKCKSCGRWSIKWRGTIPDRYCSYCGADMRGGKNGN